MPQGQANCCDSLCDVGVACSDRGALGAGGGRPNLSGLGAVWGLFVKVSGHPRLSW